MIDKKTQTQIDVLIEKISYLFNSIQQSGGVVNKIDKDLMMGYVRELYEATMSLQPDTPQQQMPPPQLMNPYQQQQPIYPQNPQQLPHQMPPYQNPLYQNPPPQTNENRNYSQQPPQENTPINGHGQSIHQSYSSQEQKKTLADLYSIKTGKEKQSVNERLNTSKTELADKLKKSPIKDLKVFIGLNKRFSYINFLFNNNTRQYDEAIDKINGSANYEAAMNYIDSELIPKYKWKAEDETVAEFYNIVERRFLM